MFSIELTLPSREEDAVKWPPRYFYFIEYKDLHANISADVVVTLDGKIIRPLIKPMTAQGDTGD